MIESFLNQVVGQRRLILSMAKRDITSRYVGSLLGFIWAFIHPAIMIFVFWVVFSVGFKSRPIQDVPFVVWLTAGMAPWFIFADIVTSSAGVIVSNAHLIKKTLFPSQILPLVRVVSAMMTHGVFIIVLLGLILFQHMPVTLYYFQFLYYLFSLCVLAFGFSLALSAINVFIRDINQITAVLIQIGFWATPIFWDITIMPEKIRFFFKLNPMFYIIQGYRDSFIGCRPFWDHPVLTAYFWCVTLFFLVVGVFVFRKLKPHFADAL